MAIFVYQYVCMKESGRSILHLPKDEIEFDQPELAGRGPGRRFIISGRSLASSRARSADSRAAELAAQRTVKNRLKGLRRKFDFQRRSAPTARSRRDAIQTVASDPLIW